MPIRIPWDRYEVALLFSAYERVADGSDIGSEAVKLSETLRNLAVQRGISINDTYRNVNGMKMQLANVQYIFTDGKKGLSGASGMIRQVYELYKANPAEYQIILKEAIQLTGTPMSVEDAFFAYAKDKTGLSPKLLAEFLENAGDFCHLKQPLLGMTDVKAVRTVQQKIAEGKLLRFRFGKDAQAIRTVTQLYYAFVKSYQAPKEALAAPVQETSDEEAPTSEAPTVIPNDTNEEWILRELKAHGIDFTDNRPVEGCLWIAADMSLPIPLEEIEQHGYKLQFKQDGCRTYPNRPVWWTKDQPAAQEYKTPKRTRKRRAVALDEFKDYVLGQGLAERTAGNYCTSIRMIESYIKQNSLNFSLLEADAEEAQQIFDLLMDRPDFVEINNQRHHQFGAAMVQYIAFLQQNEGGNNGPGQQIIVAPAKPAEKPRKAVALDEFKDYVQGQGLAERTAGNYCTSIRMIEVYIKQNNLNFSLLEAEAEEAQQIFDLLMNRSDFVEINNQRHHQFGAAMVQYIAFLQQNGGENSSSVQQAAIAPVKPAEKAKPKKQTVSAQDLLRDAAPWEFYEIVIKQAFLKGFQKESGLDLKKLRKRWLEIHGEELKDSDEAVRLQLSIHCVDTGKRWYLAELLLSENDRETVLQYIDRVLASGKQVLYYSSIYTAIEHQLESSLLTEDLLVSYLQATCQERYILREHYLTNNRSAEVNLAEEIKDVMVAHGRPIHTDELKRTLHHLPADQVERELHIHQEFVMDSFHMYFHESMADLSPEELDQIARFIQEELDDQGYMIGDWIQRKLALLYPETAERLSFLTLLGVRGAVAYKLRDRFAFNGPVITPKGKEMNMNDIYAMFCQHHTSFTLDELAEFAKQCDMMIYWDTVHRNCVRVSEKEFVATDTVHWNIPHVDAAITLRCPGRYIPLKAIQYFDAFPFVGYQWNHFLLEHYVATVSNTFTLMHSSYTKNAASGAIVRRDAGFESFDDLLADAIANAPIDLETKPCLDYLADAGYITRKKISNIPDIISRAKMLRSQKG